MEKLVWNCPKWGQEDLFLTNPDLVDIFGRTDFILWNFYVWDFFGFFRPTQKIAWEGPKWGREVFFPANPDLADILGRTDFDFESFYFWDLFGSQISRFPGPQISRFPENRSLFVGRPFFRKLCASKNDAEPYRRNVLGPNFQKHPLFQFTGLWLVNLRSWYQHLGTRILVPRSWYRDLGTKIFGGTGPGVTGEPPSRFTLTDILSLL